MSQVNYTLSGLEVEVVDKSTRFMRDNCQAVVKFPNGFHYSVRLSSDEASYIKNILGKKIFTASCVENSQVDGKNWVRCDIHFDEQFVKRTFLKGVSLLAYRSIGTQA